MWVNERDAQVPALQFMNALVWVSNETQLLRLCSKHVAPTRGLIGTTRRYSDYRACRRRLLLCEGSVLYTPLIRVRCCQHSCRSTAYYQNQAICCSWISMTSHFAPPACLCRLTLWVLGALQNPKQTDGGYTYFFSKSRSLDRRQPCV